jgi:PAS domain S-box-containing protein
MKDFFNKLSIRILLPMIFFVGIPIFLNFIVMRNSLKENEISLITEKQQYYTASLKEKLELSKQKVINASLVCSNKSYVYDAYMNYKVTSDLNPSSNILLANKESLLAEVGNIVDSKPLINYYLLPDVLFVSISNDNNKYSNNKADISKVGRSGRSIRGFKVIGNKLMTYSISPIKQKQDKVIGVVELLFPVESLLESKDYYYGVYFRSDLTLNNAAISNNLGSKGSYKNYLLAGSSDLFDKTVVSSILKDRHITDIKPSLIESDMLSLLTIDNSDGENIGFIVVQKDIRGLNSEVNKEFVTFLIRGFLILIGLSLLIYFIILKLIVKRVVTIRDAIGALADGKIIDKIKISYDDEIGVVNKALNKLGDKFADLSEFANQIGQGNNEVNLSNVNEGEILSNSLLSMKENIITANEQERLRIEEDEKRNWATSGYAKFGDILRQNSDNIDVLSNIIIKELVKYLGANQAALFIVNEEDGESFLELDAAYAYDRKKFTDKRIDIGEGLVGTCAIEKQTIYLTEIPNDYINITSGLGTAPPTSVLIVPLKIEEDIFGVIEIAAFDEFATYKIDFVEQVGESIASTLKSLRVAKRTAKLLSQSQEQAEMLHAQEEEMRQNMEELQTTQEEMQRKQLAFIENDKKTKAILSNSRDGIALISKETATIDTVNETLLNLTGYSEAELLDEHYSIIFKFLKLDKIKQGDKKRQKVISKDGNKILTDIHVGEIELDEDEMFLLFVRDVGDRVKMEQQLVMDLEKAEKQKRKLRKQEEELKMNMEEMAAQEEELRQNMEEMETIQEEMRRNQHLMEENVKKTNSILKNSVEGIALINKETGIIDTINQALVDQTKYEEVELLGMNYKNLFKFLKLEKVKQGDKKRQKVIRKDGSKFLANINVGEEIINNVDMILLFVRDVTDEVYRQQQVIIEM